MARSKFDVRIKNLDKLKRALKQSIEDILTQSDMRDIIEKAKDIIYKRVKSGYGVANDTTAGSSQVKLNELSKAYKDYRAGRVEFYSGGELVQFRVKKPKLGPYGRPNFSNLTLTGEMLESITTRIFSKGKAELKIPNTVRADGKTTNEQVAMWVSKQGRPFFNLSDKDERILDAFINRLVRDKLRRIRKL
jgi:hypothetical protein